MNPDTKPPIPLHENLVHMKMQAYGERLRNLVLEAYAEGIVLTTSEMPEQSMALLDDQGVFRVASMVPMTEYMHLVLKTPQMVTAAAVVTKGPNNEPLEIMPSVRTPLPHIPKPPEKMIPVLRKESEWCFVDPNLVQPWQSGGVETSALKFGQRFDLIGLSMREGIDPTGAISPGIALESVYVRYEEQHVERFETLRLPYALFYAATQGNYRDQSIHIPLKKNADGKWHTSAESDCDLIIDGTLNLQMGTTQLMAHSRRPGLTPLGYTLDVYSSNPNARS